MAGPIEDEFASLDKKMETGTATPTDIHRYNDLLQVLQDQERKKPKNDIVKPKFRLRGHGVFEHGFGMSMSAAAAQTAACAEFKNIYYDCATLPWEAPDAWTRADEMGDVSVRQCEPADSCTSNGVLVVDSRESPFLYRVEEGLLSERFASVRFRTRQEINDRRPPEPDGVFWGSGVMWLDDGVKSTAVGFVEDYFGQKAVMMPIAGHPDPTTGELGIEEVLTAYHDWSVWREYLLVRDAQGMIELFVDNDPTPIISYPYDALDMGSLGSPGIAFGHIIDGDNSRVTSEYDQIEYSIGLPSTGGCTSADGTIHVLYSIDQNKIFNPAFESNRVVTRVEITPVDGLASNTQGHKFYLRSDRKVSDAAGNFIGSVTNQTEIGPLGKGQNPSAVVADVISEWSGRTATGDPPPDGAYPYENRISFVRVDTKGREKTVSSIVALGAPVVANVPAPTRVMKNVWTYTKFLFFADSVKDASKDIIYQVYGCSTGADPILAVYFQEVDIEGERRFAAAASNDDWLIGCVQKKNGPFTFYACEWGAQVQIDPLSTGRVQGIVMAKPSSTTGTCSVRKKAVGAADWTPVVSGLFGGKRVDVAWKGGDQVQAVLMEKDQNTHMLVTNKDFLSNWWLPAQYDNNSGVGLGSKLDFYQDGDGFLFVSPAAAAPGGMINIYRNDFRTTDTDGDGLGDELETELGTCKSDPCTFACGTNCTGCNANCTRTTPNSGDTDGDGLGDYIEVFGCDKICYQNDGTTLKKPGCYSQDSSCQFGWLRKAEPPQYLPMWGASPTRADLFIEVDKVNSGRKIPSNEAAELAARYADPDSTLRNPDGTKGVAAHLDIGTVCQGTKNCGDWGGYTGTILDNTSVDAAYGNGSYFNPIRHGIFRYALGGFKGTGGSGVPAKTIAFNSQFGQSTWALLTHETGHSVGIQHYGYDAAGASNCKPHYSSLMSYSYSYSLNGSLNNVHFSFGEFKNVNLNPLNLCEANGLGTDDSSRISFLANGPFFFYVQPACVPGVTAPCCTAGSGVPCGVDWNRDGVIDDCTSGGVKSYIHYSGDECATMRHGQREKISYSTGTAKTEVTPTLATFDGELYLLYGEQAGMGYNLRSLRLASLNESQCGWQQPCDTWTARRLVAATVSGAAAAEIQMNSGERRLYVVYRWPADQLNFAYMDQNGIWHDEAQLVDQNGVLVRGQYDPAVTNYRGELVVVYVDPIGALSQISMDANAQWGPAMLALDGMGNPIGSGTSPALAMKPWTVWGTDQGILHVVYGRVGTLDLEMRHLNPTTTRHWDLGVSFGNYSNGNVWAATLQSAERVGFAWLPDAGAAYGGRFHMMYKGTNGIVYYNLLTTRGPGQPWQWNMNGTEDNVDTLTNFGASMAFYSGATRNGLVAVFANQSDNSVRFLPYADGLYDIDLRDANDWGPMERGICIGLRGDGSYCGQVVYYARPLANGEW